MEMIALILGFVFGVGSTLVAVGVINLWRVLR